MSLSDEVRRGFYTQPNTGMGHTTNRDAIADKIAELEQELAETTEEQNHRGDKIRELLEQNKRYREGMESLYHGLTVYSSVMFDKWKNWFTAEGKVK